MTEIGIQCALCGKDVVKTKSSRDFFALSPGYKEKMKYIRRNNDSFIYSIEALKYKTTSTRQVSKGPLQSDEATLITTR